MNGNENLLVGDFPVRELLRSSLNRRFSDSFFALKSRALNQRKMNNEREEFAAPIPKAHRFVLFINFFVVLATAFASVCSSFRSCLFRSFAENPCERFSIKMTQPTEVI